MKTSTGDARWERFAPVPLIIGIWQILTFFYPPTTVPTIPAVANKLAGILADGGSWSIMASTGWRLGAGLLLGICGGAVAGCLLGHLPRLRGMCRPLLGLVQAVPPVSWLVLALIWFGFNSRPSIFIVALSAFPVIAINLLEGVLALDPKLLQMAAIYRFGWSKRLRHIEFPSLLPYFRAGLRIVTGNGCKAVVLGEVLTTGAGIGGAITASRLAIEPEGVLAWTIIIVLFYYLLDFLVSKIPERRGARS